MKEKLKYVKEILNIISLKDDISEWYVLAYADDELGDRVNRATFVDVLSALEFGEDVYNVIGVGDSVIRERIFEELAKRLGVNYNDIYNLWLS